MSEKRQNTRNRRAWTAAMLFGAVVGLITLVSGWISPQARDFCQAACPWVLMAVGLAGFAAGADDGTK